eukprot:TRINITY_DN1754_c0_g1_i3.p1 TRINITY_DN1754_c0_g1~~TRINITY_DN1754_c0_g1_i3.p1  ORF type:complete len:951 (-),score=307.89 TRINITY_DN1754_c0_g1_i3:781-3633(-)
MAFSSVRNDERGACSQRGSFLSGVCSQRGSFLSESPSHMHNSFSGSEEAEDTAEEEEDEEEAQEGPARGGRQQCEAKQTMDELRSLVTYMQESLDKLLDKKEEEDQAAELLSPGAGNRRAIDSAAISGNPLLQQLASRAKADELLDVEEAGKTTSPRTRRRSGALVPLVQIESLDHHAILRQQLMQGIENLEDSKREEVLTDTLQQFKTITKDSAKLVKDLNRLEVYSDGVPDDMAKQQGHIQTTIKNSNEKTGRILGNFGYIWEQMCEQYQIIDKERRRLRGMAKQDLDLGSEEQEQKTLAQRRKDEKALQQVILEVKAQQAERDAKSENRNSMIALEAENTDKEEKLEQLKKSLDTVTKVCENLEAAIEYLDGSSRGVLDEMVIETIEEAKLEARERLLYPALREDDELRGELDFTDVLGREMRSRRDELRAQRQDLEDNMLSLETHPEGFQQEAEELLEKLCGPSTRHYFEVMPLPPKEADTSLVRAMLKEELGVVWGKCANMWRRVMRYEDFISNAQTSLQALVRHREQFVELIGRVKEDFVKEASEELMSEAKMSLMSPDHVKDPLEKIAIARLQRKHKEKINETLQKLWRTQERMLLESLRELEERGRIADRMATQALSSSWALREHYERMRQEEESAGKDVRDDKKRPSRRLSTIRAASKQQVVGLDMPQILQMDGIPLLRASVESHSDHVQEPFGKWIDAQGVKSLGYFRRKSQSMGRKAKRKTKKGGGRDTLQGRKAIDRSMLNADIVPILSGPSIRDPDAPVAAAEPDPEPSSWLFKAMKRKRKASLVLAHGESSSSSSSEEEKEKTAQDEKEEQEGSQADGSKDGLKDEIGEDGKEDEDDEGGTVKAADTDATSRKSSGSESEQEGSVDGLDFSDTEEADRPLSQLSGRLSSGPLSPSGRTSPSPLSPSGRTSPSPLSLSGRTSPSPLSPSGRMSPGLD